MKKLFVFLIFIFLNSPSFASPPIYLFEDEDFDLSGRVLKETTKETRFDIFDSKTDFEELLKEKPEKEEMVEDSELLEGGVWEFVKGEPINDSVMLGMFSEHVGTNKFNESHNLFGVDYKGYSVGTFKNSFSNQTYYAGISRKVYEIPFQRYKFDVKYKVILMHGYGDIYPNAYGVTPVVMPMFGISRGHTGLDFMAIPSNHPVFTVNFRVNLPQGSDSTE